MALAFRAPGKRVSARHASRAQEVSLDALTWVGVAFCLSLSAMFSGLNLAFFSLGRLDLEIQAKSDPKARRVLEIRRTLNHLLTTILWGHVGINVLLTLLTDSVLAGGRRDAGIARDVVLVWGERPLILTGADTLRRLLAGA